MISLANDIAQAFATRLAEIRTANGYLTEIGAKVIRGRTGLVEGDLPCTVIVEGEDSVQDEAASLSVKLRQAYIFEGQVIIDESEINNPALAQHRVLHDLKVCIFGPLAGPINAPTYLTPFKINRQRVHYVGRSFGMREDSSNIVSAAMEIAVDYSEDLSTAQ